jgi:hypothetical protein
MLRFDLSDWKIVFIDYYILFLIYFYSQNHSWIRLRVLDVINPSQKLEIML